MTNEKYPLGWNEARVRRVLEYYESQTDEEAAAEIEAAFKGATHTTMEVPVSLVPVVRRLIAARKSPAHPKKTHNTALQPTSRAQRKSKPQKNPRAPRG